MNLPKFLDDKAKLFLFARGKKDKKINE